MLFLFNKEASFSLMHLEEPISDFTYLSEYIGQIALGIASSGAAATLLDGGRTAHSALKLPPNVQLKEYKN